MIGGLLPAALGNGEVSRDGVRAARERDHRSGRAIDANAIPTGRRPRRRRQRSSFRACDLPWANLNGVEFLFPISEPDPEARLQLLYDRLAARFGFDPARVRALAAQADRRRDRLRSSARDRRSRRTCRRRSRRTRCATRPRMPGPGGSTGRGWHTDASSAVSRDPRRAAGRRARDGGAARVPRDARAGRLPLRGLRPAFPPLPSVPRRARVPRLPPRRPAGAPAPPAVTTVTTQRRGILLVAAAALLWSTGGIGIKLLSRAAARHCVLSLGHGRGGASAHLPAAGLALDSGFLIGLVSYAACLTTFVLATKWTSAANAIFIQYSGVIWVLLASPLVLQRAPAAQGRRRGRRGLRGHAPLLRRPLRSPGHPRRGHGARVQPLLRDARPRPAARARQRGRGRGDVGQRPRGRSRCCPSSAASLPAAPVRGRS